MQWKARFIYYNIDKLYWEVGNRIPNCCQKDVQNVSRLLQIITKICWRYYVAFPYAEAALLAAQQKKEEA